VRDEQGIEAVEGDTLNLIQDGVQTALPMLLVRDGRKSRSPTRRACRAVIFEAIEAALASAAKKRYHEQDVLRVAINPSRTAATRPSAAGRWSPTTW
jgi:hypothetical protein